MFAPPHYPDAATAGTCPQLTALYPPTRPAFHTLAGLLLTPSDYAVTDTVVQNGQCRKPDGRTYYSQTQGHAARILSGLATAKSCQVELAKAKAENPNFMYSAEWSGDYRGLCWMHSVPKAYAGNGHSPYKCIIEAPPVPSPPVASCHAPCCGTGLRRHLLAPANVMLLVYSKTERCGGYIYSCSKREAEQKCASRGRQLCKTHTLSGKSVCAYGWTSDSNCMKFYIQH